MSRLQEIAAREAAATKGPWRAVNWDSYGDEWMVVDEGSQPAFYGAICENIHQGHDRGEADAKFIAHARLDVPWMIERLTSVATLCDEYRANCDPTSMQARVAELFRAALEGAE